MSDSFKQGQNSSELIPSCHSERSHHVIPSIAKESVLPLVISSGVQAFRSLSFRAQPQAESRNLFDGFFCPGAWTLLLHASFSGYARSGRRLTANSLS